MDQQLFLIAKQVMWHLPDELNNHTMRLGGFHTQFCFISSIGQLCGDGGLRDTFIDPGVYASATVDQNVVWKAIQMCCLWFDVRNTR